MRNRNLKIFQPNYFYYFTIILGNLMIFFYFPLGFEFIGKISPEGIKPLTNLILERVVMPFFSDIL